MKKIIIITSVLLIAIAVIAAMYFSELSGNTHNSTKVLKYIPSDAALVVSFSNDESFYDIFRDFELFDAIIGEKRAAEFSQLQALLLKQAALKEVTENKKIFISFHPRKTDSVDLLFTLNMKEDISEKDAAELLKSAEGVSVKNTAWQNIYQINLNTIEAPFFLFVTKGAAAGSFSEELLRRAVDQQTEKISRQFMEEINENVSGNQNSPVSLFVDHHTLGPFFKSFIRGRSNGNSLLLRDMQGFSSLNMNFKSDALMFNGISTPDSSAYNYLNLFLNQRPVRNQIKALLPENTANCILFGLSDYRKFHAGLRRYLDKKGDLKKLENQVKFIRSATGINIDNDIKQKLANEFTIIETAAHERIGIIRVVNGIDINFSLQLISRQVSGNISRFNHSNILYYYLGDPFKNFPRPCFTVIDNYLVVANTVAGIQSYMESYLNGRFLAKTREFSEHDQLVANKSNILYFINNKESAGIIKATLKKGFAETFTDPGYGLKNFYGLSWQWSSDGSHFQTNAYANYIIPDEKTLKEAWSFKLNARIAAAPQVFMEGDRHIILTQDNVNNIYALTEDGKKLWAIQIDGKILGPVHQLNDSTLVFNTMRKLHRINTKGYNVEGFPVNLPFNASAGLTPAGTDPAAVKLFIPAGSLIMAYNGLGKPLEGWNKELSAKIISDLKTVNISNTNYLIAGTETGKFFFFNFNGQLAGKAENTSSGTLFKNRLIAYTGNDAGNSGVITTDTAGIIYSIALSGSISRQNTDVWQGEHTFDYSNVAGDEKPELIYLGKNQLSVYNQDKTIVYTYEFDHPVQNHLQLFALNKGEYAIGISSKENNQLYLFDRDGNLFRGFPVKGINDFYIGYLKNDGIRYLLCGSSDNYLRAYKL